MYMYISILLSLSSAQVGLKGENGRPASTIDGQFVRDKNRMSLPSHYRQQARPPLTGDLFDRRPLNDQNGQAVKALSRSSGELSCYRITFSKAKMTRNALYKL